MEWKGNVFVLIGALVVIVAAIYFLEPSGPTGPVVAANSNVSVQAGVLNATALQQVLEQEKELYQPAPELVDPTGFINAPDNFTLASLVGKDVVLLDFWTYSCINCQRTIPYLNAWYQEYKGDGLVIVGVHTPEFDFEKNYSNVVDAVKQLGIQYPVVLDSNYGTWAAYQNSYWPHEYLINIDGYIVSDHIGEGGYNDTETEIRQLLEQRAQRLGVPLNFSGQATPVNATAIDFQQVQSQETYFGSGRNEFLANGVQGQAGLQNLTLPNQSQLSPNLLYLGGEWNFSDQYATSTGPVQIEYQFNAKNMYFVSAAAQGNVTASITIDGQPLNSTNAGADVAVQGNSSTVTIGPSTLYSIVSEPDYGEHTVVITAPAGLQAYTFTFG